MPARAILAAALLAVPLFLLITTGCEEDPACTPCVSGIIFGKVTTVGAPVSGSIVAMTSWDDAHRGEDAVHATARIDSLGHYSLSVPVGRYTLWVRVGFLGAIYAYQGSLSSTDADTISIVEGTDPVEVNVSLGAARIVADTPPEWEGTAVRLQLQPKEGYGAVFARGEGTAQSGKLEVAIPVLIPGAYVARVHDPEGTVFWLPATHTMANADPIDVIAGVETVYEPVIPSPARLTGTITGTWIELSARHPELTLINSDSIKVGSRYAERNGDFELRVYEPMRARLLTNIEWVLGWYGGDSFASAAVIDLALGSEVNADIVESAISVRLDTNACCYKAELYDEEPEQIARINFYSGRDEFSVSNLSPGNYYIRFIGNSSRPTFWHDAADSIDSATPIEVTEEGQIVWIESSWVEGGSITGQVLDPAGQPVPTATLSLTLADTEREQRRVHMADAEGWYKIENLHNGAYKLAAKTSVYPQTWYPGVAQHDSATVIAIEDWEDVEGITIQLLE